MANKKSAKKAETPVVEQALEPAEEKTMKRYLIIHLMNVRASPSTKAPKKGLIRKGTLVDAVLEGGWLRLKEGGYVLFGREYATEEE